MPFLFSTTPLDFQLPLSQDHIVADKTTVELRYNDLSTPSLGITEPDSGFFGSPRLSAAAPLRTNDFKGHYLDISFRPFIRGL
jgi:hypothetical protein